MTLPVDRSATTPLLSERATLKLIQQAKCGDLRSEDRIIRHSARLIQRALSSLSCPQALRDDLYQEGQIAMRAAIIRYRPERGVSWPPYAYRCVRCAMLDALKTPANVPIPSTGHNSFTTLPSVRPDEQPEDSFFITCDRVYVRAYLSVLPPRERDVVVSYYGLDTHPQSLESLGDRLQISYQRAQQLRNQALYRLQDNLEKASYTVAAPTN